MFFYIDGFKENLHSYLMKMMHTLEHFSENEKIFLRVSFSESKIFMIIILLLKFLEFEV